MSRQLHNPSRRLQPNLGETKQQSVDRVVSEELVSALRHKGSCRLTHGFVTRNPQDATDVIDRFICFEKVYPDHFQLCKALLEELEKCNGELHFDFPEHLSDRWLVRMCPSVDVKQCVEKTLTVRFEQGFSDNDFCSRCSQYPEIPIGHINFELLHILGSHGTKAFSGPAAARALCDQIADASLCLDRSDSFLIERNGCQFAVQVQLLYCPATSAEPRRTANDLLVFPVSSIPTTSGLTERVSLFVTYNPRDGESCISGHSCVEENLTSVCSNLKDTMLKLFGERSPKRITSVANLT